VISTKNFSTRPIKLMYGTSTWHSVRWPLEGSVVLGSESVTSYQPTFPRFPRVLRP
jgi:hypothetical protein